MTNPGLFLFISVRDNHHFTDEAVGFSSILTRIVGVEGEHVDHLTMAPCRPCCLVENLPLSFFVFISFERVLKKWVSNSILHTRYYVVISGNARTSIFRLIYLLSWIGHCPTPASFIICFVCARERMEAGFELTTLLYLGQWKTLQCETVS